MKKNIQISEVFTIDTDENRCALLFCMHLQHELDDANMLFITANNYQLVHDNLERVKPYISYFDAVHARTKHLFLKDSWLNLNEQYGARALSNELSALVEKSPKELFFMHRIDLFFDKAFSKELEDVIIGFIKDIRYHHKKVIFSYNSKTVSGKAFEELFVDRRDISYHIEEDKSDVDGDCYSTIKTYNKFLKKTFANICLISDNKEIISMHETLFSQQKNIKYNHFNLAEDVSLIDSETDIVIYHDSLDVSESRIKNIKNIAHFTKIFLLNDKKFLRKSDKSGLSEKGIDYIAANNVDIEEYVGSIEAVIENDFYTQKLKSMLSLGWPSEVDFQGLKKHLLFLRDKQVIHTLLSVQREDIM
ncbi:MAG TPA: hypothetical protein EYG95_00200, partial [Campylobacterales bacterium]|nr:hypothetical protein [Campylobacterales bacterium]